eukprot:11165556-Lingulodinium_polyedra.AAC.1
MQYDALAMTLKAKNERLLSDEQPCARVARGPSSSRAGRIPSLSRRCCQIPAPTAKAKQAGYPKGLE